MDLGVGLPTKANSWEVVKRAEELGYTHAWFYDTQLLNAEMFGAMAAAAMKTSKIKLGTGVVIPSNRIAPVTASGLGTINALAPGRVVFGVSTGFTGRRTLGLRPVTLARLEEYVRVVTGLLRGRDGRLVGGRRNPQDPLPQPGARTDQHQGSDPDLPVGIRTKSPAPDGEARRRLVRRCKFPRARKSRARRDQSFMEGVRSRSQETLLRSPAWADAF